MDCAERSLACRVKALELIVAGGTHPPASLSYGGPAFSWDVLSQYGNIPIHEIYAFEGVAPDDDLVLTGDRIYLHHVPMGMLLTDGIRINVATAGPLGLKVQLYVDNAPMFAAPLLLSGSTQLYPVTAILAGQRTIGAGALLEAEVTSLPSGGWKGLSVDYMGYLDLNSVSPGTPPFNISAPQITGLTTVGSLLTANVGTWSGTPTVYTYQWLVNGVPVVGANTPFYTIQAGDAGLSITLLVTATNTFGSTVATANAIVVDSPNAAPQNAAAPTLTGDNFVGGTLIAGFGSWTNSPTSYSYQWKRNGFNIPSATAASYVLTPDDYYSTITVGVTASNTYGSSPQATSTGTAIIS